MLDQGISLQFVYGPRKYHYKPARPSQIQIFLTSPNIFLTRILCKDLSKDTILFLNTSIIDKLIHLLVIFDKSLRNRKWYVPVKTIQAFYLKNSYFLYKEYRNEVQKSFECVQITFLGTSGFSLKPKLSEAKRGF